jgi:hypothetical protein
VWLCCEFDRCLLRKVERDLACRVRVELGLRKPLEPRHTPGLIPDCRSLQNLHMTPPKSFSF